MIIEKLIPLPTDKVSFVLSSFKQVPYIEGCYILSTFSNEILYIGLSKNLNSRFRQHLDNSEKTNPTTNGKAVWFHYASFDPTNLPKLERTWLNQFLNIHGHLPVLNKINPPIS